MKEKNREQLVHPLEPIYDKDSKILLLGTFPSVKSREVNFYYGNKQNRFWYILSRMLQYDLQDTIEDKKAMLYQHHIAVADVLKSCEIIGSSDASIQHPVVSDIMKVVENSKIQALFFNGSKAFELYDKFVFKKPDIPTFTLKSTSPANATCKTEALYWEWDRIIRPYLSTENKE